MYKKFLLLLLVSFSVSSHAEMFELRKVMLCEQKEVVFESLSENFQEFPIWSGSSRSGTVIAIFVNKTNGSYTVIEYDSKVACVLSVGGTKVININSNT